jgi:hypothetical protein
MTTPPPRGEADEPAPIRETGLGWPDQPPPPDQRPSPDQPPPPEPPPPPAAPRGAIAAAPDPEFAEAVRKFRASSSQARPARPASPARLYQPTQPYRPYPDRPGTVTAAAVILFVSAGLGLLACCGINLLAGEAELEGDEQTVLLVFSVVIAVVSLLNALFGYFILQGRQWARVTIIVLCALGIAGSLVGLFIGAGSEDAGSNGLSTCFGLVLNIVIIVLLSGERASDYFRSARG